MRNPSVSLILVSNNIYALTVINNMLIRSTSITLSFHSIRYKNSVISVQLGLQLIPGYICLLPFMAILPSQLPPFLYHRQDLLIS
ncbi:hypothetical protein BDB01DRAFT_809109 [Pilobolus umbonatus]|nr:hypothetical protein BDB01DRAFT_809109 [Pilobolus umbonatus]